MPIYRRKDSPYWWVKFPPIRGESKSLQQSTGTANRREAQEVHDRLAHERWEQERLGVKARHDWQEAAERWILETKHKATHGDDIAKLRWLHPYLGDKQLDEIDRTLIDRIKFDREKLGTAGTTNRYLALIRSILRRACDDWDWIDKVPKVKLFKEPEGRVRSLTVEEFRRLLAELPEHLADLAIFSVATGWRQANARDLEWPQVDLEQCFAWVPAGRHKNGKLQSSPLNEMALSVLQKQIGKHPKRVFTYRGEPIGQVNTKAWTSALTRAGITDFRWHDLRHTFATSLRLGGAAAHEIQILGGWQDRAMVDRYAHTPSASLRAAAAKLDRVFGYETATPQRPTA